MSLGPIDPQPLKHPKTRVTPKWVIVKIRVVMGAPG